MSIKKKKKGSTAETSAPQIHQRFFNPANFNNSEFWFFPLTLQATLTIYSHSRTSRTAAEEREKIKNNSSHCSTGQSWWAEGTKAADVRITSLCSWSWF